MSALEALASRVGIEEQFRDAKGEIRQTSAETRTRLLAAMGIAAGSEAEVAEALRTLDDAEWQRSLPPVRVVRPDDLTVEAVVPAGTSEFAWNLVLEDGNERAGTCVCGRSSQLASRQLLERHRLVLETAIPFGYHRLRSGIDESECSLIVTPGRCWLPDAFEQKRRLWGVAAQLYLLRSRHNWGIGDFTDLRQLVELVRERGGHVIGLNPLHAMFLDNPEHASPYSPESRLLLNVLNIDVEAVPEFAQSSEAQQYLASPDCWQKLEHCRLASLVDYAAVAALKVPALQLLFKCCLTAGSTRWKEFQSFRAAGGETFERNCLFEALREHFAGNSWPAEYREASSPAVSRFAEEHASDVTFHAWMQWLADEQLGAAAAAANGMEIGLYRDLAVGTDPSGAATWSSPAALVSGASVGAPPDIYNPAGQDWGLPPFHPRALFESGFREFIELVRANMRHAGGLRIDHAMALQHLYWVPKGGDPAEGAYIRYPLSDLVGILALESHRNRCLVVGEDLGTVPEGFRDRMMEANILSYRVLFFEQDAESGEFLPPASYPRLALAVTGSHDLPTVKAWWEGRDIELRENLQLFPTVQGATEARKTRERDRCELVKALRREQLLPGDGAIDVESLIAAVHAYLAQSEALIALMQLDDICAETEPVNVPTSSDEHPNWRRRLSLSLEELPAHPRTQKLIDIFSKERS